jgi:hypothetical protein
MPDAEHLAGDSLRGAVVTHALVGTMLEKLQVSLFAVLSAHSIPRYGFIGTDPTRP